MLSFKVFTADMVYLNWAIFTGQTVTNSKSESI